MVFLQAQLFLLSFIINYFKLSVLFLNLSVVTLDENLFHLVTYHLLQYFLKISQLFPRVFDADVKNGITVLPVKSFSFTINRYNNKLILIYLSIFCINFFSNSIKI